MIFAGFLVASLLHMTEEYFYPGGFRDATKMAAPAFAPFITVPAALVINGLQLLLCVISIIVNSANLAFSLSVGALIFVNGLLHVGASLKFRRYMPGAITGGIVYIPLAVYAFWSFAASGQLKLEDGVIAGLLGIFYHLLLLGYFGAARIITRSRL